MRDGKLRAGVIGFGVGKVYAASLRALHDYYPDLPVVELAAVATASEASAARAREHFGFALATTDYRKLIAADDLDLLVIAAPPRWRRPMVEEALATRKALYVDKPLAVDLQDAQAILARGRALGRDAQMIFEFRFCPAVLAARQMIGEGALGEIYAFRGVYFRSSYANPATPLRWKGSRAESGGGSVNDTTPHVIDLLTWMLGMPDKVAAQTRTFVPERPAGRDDPRRVAVETDDHVLLMLTLPGGAVGTIESGRLIPGSVHDLGFEIHGSRASLRWSLMDTNHLYLAEYNADPVQSGWKQLPTMQRYPQAALPGWDVPVGMMRFHLASLGDFVRRSLAGESYDPGLAQGTRVQAVVQAAIDSAAAQAWVPVAGV
ncbi:MAG: hypothetical protein A2Y93_17015 [Chloroflexi bacterium RBG_13_68_17]|nr:MAG: hypothetical protein A2Y93_17015 [Chloroflexi bacterium RBG_13_68_17]